jgi:hypothetical protein
MLGKFVQLRLQGVRDPFISMANGKAKAPPPPDYAAAAAATAAGNLETAKYTTSANRVNQVTPYGNLNYSMTPTVDQGAYDKAMADYQSQLANYNQSLQSYNNQPAANNYNPFMMGGMGGMASFANQSRGEAPVAPIAPTADKYQTGQNWTATQTLSPEQQAIYEQESRLNQGLLSTANRGLDYANNVLSQPGVDLSQLPSLTSNVPAGRLATGYNVQSATGNVANPMLQTNSGANFNARNDLVNNANQMMTNANANQMAGGNVANPNVQTSLNLSGVPALKSNIDQYGQIQNQINTQGLPSYGINPGETFSDAIMRRLQPDLERQRSAEESRLANQGIGLGSNAYSTAKDILGRQQNDAMTSAIIQGMGVGLQANQQQFGQNAAQQQATNAAQAQGFGQNAAQTQAQNAANSQAFQQALAGGQFGNQAAGQQFGQNLSAQQLQNQAAAQNNATNLANAGFTNQALSNQFGQNLSANQFANQVGQQNNANALANAQFANQAAGQQFGQNISAAQLANQAAAQNTGNAANLAAFGNQSVGQQFQQGLANAQLGNQAQQQGFQQQAYNQMQPINVINALRTGSQVQNPSYAQSAQMPQVAGADMLGATQQGYNAQIANVNAQNAASGGFMGGLMNLGGAYLMSDENLKTDIKRIGTHDLGMGIYSYSYKDGYNLPTGIQVGVMAQEVEKVIPEAVIVTDSGFKAVNYAML